MGFWKDEYCPICGRKISGVLSFRIKDDIAICSMCFGNMNIDYSLLKFQSIKNIKECLKYSKENLELFKSFNTTREIKVGDWFFREDENLSLWYASTVKNPKNPTIYKYDEIVDFRLIEDGNNISSGGLGRALAGGFLFGGVGAIVGGVTGQKTSKNVLTSLQIIITLNNRYNNNITVHCIPAGIKCKSGSVFYNMYKNEANNLISFLSIMCDKAKKSRLTIDTEIIQNKETTSNIKDTSIDDIYKYKDLLDKGIITPEEFAIKKKEILDL